MREDSKIHRGWLKGGSLLGKSLGKALAHCLVCTSQMLQHCWNIFGNGCSHTCWTKEKMSPLIFLALALGMEIMLCWPVSVGGHTCWKSKHSQASALIPHTGNLRMPVGFLPHSGEPKGKSRARKDMSRTPWLSCSLITEYSDSCVVILSLIQDQVLAGAFSSSAPWFGLTQEQFPPVLAELLPGTRCLASQGVIWLLQQRTPGVPRAPC